MDIELHEGFAPHFTKKQRLRLWEKIYQAYILLWTDGIIVYPHDYLEVIRVARNSVGLSNTPNGGKRYASAMSLISSFFRRWERYHANYAPVVKDIGSDQFLNAMSCISMVATNCGSMEILPDGKTLRLVAPERLPDGLIEEIKASKADVIKVLQFRQLKALRANCANVQSYVSDSKIREFYESFEWRRIRYQILKKYEAKCMLCNRDRSHGIILNVDHIKPLRLHWGLRLDFDNLQVLCNECNHGKGSRYTDDWRRHKRRTP